MAIKSFYLEGHPDLKTFSMSISVKTKYHRTFVCGGVVLAVLNLRTKNPNQ